MTAVVCTDLAVGHRDRAVLRDVTVTVAPGEVLAVLGPSGSGKTTLLHAIAGFLAPLAGRITLGTHAVSGPDGCIPPELRRIGMVFQDYALWPHLSVVDIVAYPLRRRGVSTANARRRATALLDTFGLGHLADRRPAELSGGEQQRVGLVRALACDPAVYLFDEPTAHLDAHLRAQVVAELAERRAASGAAAMLATHDAAEAMGLADRVAVLHSGRCMQIGTPAEVYAHPVDLDVARLTGPVSVLHAPVRPGGDGTFEVRIGGTAVLVPCAEPAPGRPRAEPAPGRPRAEPAPGRPRAKPALATVLVRPDWAALPGPLPATVAATRYAGPHTDYHLDTPAGRVVVRTDGPPRHAAGERVTWDLRRIWVVDRDR